MSSARTASCAMFKSERFDLRKLYYFTRIVEIASISRASVELGVAQPALSKSVRMLEYDLRTSLLERSSKGVRPTKSGMRLYEHCKTVFRQLELARTEIQGTGDTPMGNVTLGMPYSVSLVLAAPLLQEALRRFPGIDLQIVENRSTTLTDDLLACRIDLGITIPEGNHQHSVATRDLIEEDYLFVRMSDGQTPCRDVVGIAELEDAPLILPGGQGRRMLEDRFALRHCRLNAVREIDTLSMIPHCVEIGLGQSILPSGFVGSLDHHRMTGLRFDDRIMTRRLAICHPAARPLNLAALRLTELVEEVSADLIAHRRWRGARMISESAYAH